MLWFPNVHFKRCSEECCIITVIINGEPLAASAAHDPFRGSGVPVTLILIIHFLALNVSFLRCCKHDIAEWN